MALQQDALGPRLLKSAEQKAFLADLDKILSLLMTCEVTSSVFSAFDLVIPGFTFARTKYWQQTFCTVSVRFSGGLFWDPPSI